MKKDINVNGQTIVTTVTTSNLASSTNLIGVAKNGSTDTTEGFAGKTALNQ
jgi:hypothetical protein